MALGFPQRTQLLLLIPAFISVACGNTFYTLKFATDSPVTSGAQATVNSSLFFRKDSVTQTLNPSLYQFHWIYTPLLLTHQSENESCAGIKVLAKAPGNYTVSVQVTEGHCRSCEVVARGATHLYVTKSIVGDLTATQRDGNTTSIRRGSSFATNDELHLSFIIRDPSDFFKAAVFTYVWSFGDGAEIVTSEPSVSHKYPIPGRYKANVQVSAHLQSSRHRRSPWQKTGRFEAPLTLRDVLKNITVAGPSQTAVGERFHITLHFFGSPPLSVCYLIKPECVSLDGDECHAVEINDNTYSISHVFNKTGLYCLSVKAKNDISMLRNYHAITAYATGVHQIWFILPSCAFILIVLGIIVFIIYKSSSCASHQNSLVEVADFDFSPRAENYQPLPPYKEVSARNFSCTLCTGDISKNESETRVEEQPLLPPSSQSARSYML
ncbi:transmembrane protein 130 [Spea bombifrons]|uniref:transmembrane protein 130 n=1 Tax=Spea bombifrons TaxID=233779 RepID=UPI00234973A3|nr:transmembrane protein 130 [Spea bombifrons]